MRDYILHIACQPIEGACKLEVAMSKKVSQVKELSTYPVKTDSEQITPEMRQAGARVIEAFYGVVDLECLAVDVYTAMHNARPATQPRASGRGHSQMPGQRASP